MLELQLSSAVGPFFDERVFAGAADPSQVIVVSLSSLPLLAFEAQI